MRDAVRLDDGVANRILATVLVEDVSHRQDSFQRIALSTARRRNVSLPRRYPDAVVENAINGLRRNAGAVVLDDDRVPLHGDRDDRRDLGFLAGVESVID